MRKMQTSKSCTTKPNPTGKTSKLQAGWHQSNLLHVVYFPFIESFCIIYRLPQELDQFKMKTKVCIVPCKNNKGFHLQTRICFNSLVPFINPIKVMILRMGEPNLHRPDCFQSHTSKPVILVFFVALPLKNFDIIFFIVSSRSVNSTLDSSGLVASESDTSCHCSGGKSHMDCFSISDNYFIISLLLFITSQQEIAFFSLASVGWIRENDYFFSSFNIYLQKLQSSKCL